MYYVYICLLAWILVFVLSIYLHEMIHQDYGTTKIPPCFQQFLDIFEKTPKEAEY